MSRAWDKEIILSPHEESNLRPSDLRSDALPLSHKDSSVSGVYYEVLMTRVLHTARISNVDSVRKLFVTLDAWHMWHNTREWMIVVALVFEVILLERLLSNFHWGVALPRGVIGPENSCHSLNQSFYSIIRVSPLQPSFLMKRGWTSELLCDNVMFSCFISGNCIFQRMTWLL